MLIISTHLFLQRAPLFLWVLPLLLLPRFSSVSLLQFGLQNLFLSLWSLLLRLLSHEDASKYVSFFFLFFWFCHIFAPFFYFFNCCLFSKSGISELDCLCFILIAVFFFLVQVYFLVGGCCRDLLSSMVLRRVVGFGANHFCILSMRINVFGFVLMLIFENDYILYTDYMM